MAFRPLDILLEYARSTNPDVRANAVAALGQLDGPAARHRVMDLLSDPDGRVRDSAFSAFKAAPPEAGFVKRLLEAFRLRARSADLVARRAPGPSAAGAAAALVLGLLVYVLMTVFVYRRIDAFYWEAFKFSGLAVAIGCLFVLMASLAARPAAHYKHTLAGVFCELAWMAGASFILAALGSAVLAISLSAGSSNASPASAAVSLAQGGSILDVSTILLLVLGIMFTAISARLAAALVARATREGGLRGSLVALAAFGAGWLTVWLFLLVWSQRAQQDLLAFEEVIGRIALIGFVSVGAIAATLGHVESAGVRQRIAPRRPWVIRASGAVLAAPGLANLALFPLMLSLSSRAVDIEKLETTVRFRTPQLVRFNVPIDSEILVEIPESSKPAAARNPVLQARLLFEQYGPSPVSRKIARSILSGDLSPMELPWSSTKQGADFWVKESVRFDDDDPLSPEALAILRYWADSAPLASDGFDPDDLGFVSESWDENRMVQAGSGRDWANRPDPLPKSEHSVLLSATARSFAISSDNGAQDEIVLGGPNDWTREARVPAGEVHACIRSWDSAIDCESARDFAGFFGLIGVRSLESWPFVGRRPIDGEIRLTVLSNRDDAAFGEAIDAVRLLRRAPHATQSNAVGVLYVALTAGAVDLAKDARRNLVAGEVVLAGAANNEGAKDRKEKGGEPARSQLDEEQTTDARTKPALQRTLVEMPKQRDGSASLHIRDTAVAEIAFTNPQEAVRYVDAAIKLGSAFEDFGVQRLDQDALQRAVADSVQHREDRTSEYALLVSDKDGALVCRHAEYGFDVIVAGRADVLDTVPIDLAHMRLALGGKWAADFAAFVKTLNNAAPATAPGYDVCEGRAFPERAFPEGYFGDIPTRFRPNEAQKALDGDAYALDQAFLWRTSKQGREFWAGEAERLNENLGLTAVARMALDHWIRLDKLSPKQPRGTLPPEFDFGDDSGAYANDGECDDGRFEGGGIDSHIGRDATDCREAFEAGETVLLRAFEARPREALPPGFDFGDDSGSYANDGACDDARFEGGGIESHVRRDATDCRRAFELGLTGLLR